MEEIDFVQSKKQEQILGKLEAFKSIVKEDAPEHKTKLIKPSHDVFDTIDEVKTALKIARKLLEEGESDEDILIVASDIAEYAPFYKLFLNEYALQGYSSIGTPLTSFHNTSQPKVKRALDQYKSQVQSTEALYKRLGLKLSDAGKEKIKESIKILDDKIGLELTEPNQLVGLHRTYKHIIFMGTDINHFPPQAKDNFLYTYDDDVKYFYANNYFTSSQTQLNELKRMAENLYIITANYSGKRELTPSILLDGKYDDSIDLSGVKVSMNWHCKERPLFQMPILKRIMKALRSEAFSKFDGMGVEGTEAKHLSASQINKYTSCPLAYLYSSKVRIQAPNQSDEGFDVMEQGSLMHLCYELFGKRN